MAFRKEREDLLLIHVRGFLKYSDRQEIDRLGRIGIDRTRKIKMLVIATDFSGWGKEGDWGDLRFMHDYDSCIEKIAVVADEKWKEQTLRYLRAGERQASVAFFSPPQAEDAQNWLEVESE